MYGGLASNRRCIFMLTVVWHLVQLNNRTFGDSRESVSSIQVHVDCVDPE